MENSQDFFDLFDCQLDTGSVDIWVCCDKGSDFEFYIAGDENEPNLNLQKKAIRILKALEVVEIRVKDYLAAQEKFERTDGSLMMRFDYPDYPNHANMWKAEWVDLFDIEMDLFDIESVDQYRIHCSISGGDWIQHGSTGFRDAFEHFSWSVLIQNDMPMSYRVEERWLR